MNAIQFLNDDVGVAGTGRRLWHARRAGFLVDPLYDVRLKARSEYRKLRATLRNVPVQKILLVGVEVAARAAMMKNTLQNLQSNHHFITINVKEAEGFGKLENINLLLSGHDIEEYDWIVMTDDDISTEAEFLDILIACCMKYEFKIAMPAHRFGSYVGYELTKRCWGTIVRSTNFVEVGPVTVFHKDVFSKIFPLPVLKYGWGADFHWPLLAKQNGWRIGVIDAAPMMHLRPIGGSYSRDNAMAEAASYLDAHGYLPRSETFSVLRAW